MSIDLPGLINAVTSYGAASGHFDVVQGHEPKSAPGNGLTLAVFLSAIGPVARASGLDATTARVELTARIYKPFLSEPQDLIDPAVGAAAVDLIAAYSADFDLGGLARNVDLLGGNGAPLAGRAGYQRVDATTYRVFDIVIPIIVNDAWTQGA